MADGKILLEVDKFYLQVKRTCDKRRVRYNLKTKQLQKLEKSKWHNVENQYRFFQGFGLNDVEFKNPKWKKMLLLNKSLNPDCISLSTFLTKLPDLFIFEGYITEGIAIKVEREHHYDGIYRVRGPMYPLSDYNKASIKFLKQRFPDTGTRYQDEISGYFEHNFLQDQEKSLQIIKALNSYEIDNETKNDIIKELFIWSSSRMGNLTNMVGEYNYDLKSLLGYICNYLMPFEGLEFQESLTLLSDYYRMGSRIGRKIKKYPKYLKSMHDIIKSNYNAYKKEYDEQLFQQLMKKELEHKGDKFCIIIPKSSKDIISEGTSLNHCVGSYVKKILDEKTYIFFLRLKKKPEESLVTLEFIEGAITQAKGSYNRAIDEKERKYLESFCRIKKLKLEV